MKPRMPTKIKSKIYNSLRAASQILSAGGAGVAGASADHNRAATAGWSVLVSENC